MVESQIFYSVNEPNYIKYREEEIKSKFTRFLIRGKYAKLNMFNGFVKFAGRSCRLYHMLFSKCKKRLSHVVVVLSFLFIYEYKNKLENNTKSKHILERFLENEEPSIMFSLRHVLLVDGNFYDIQRSKFPKF